MRPKAARAQMLEMAMFAATADESKFAPKWLADQTGNCFGAHRRLTSIKSPRPSTGQGHHVCYLSSSLTLLCALPFSHPSDRIVAAIPWFSFMDALALSRPGAVHRHFAFEAVRTDGKINWKWHIDESIKWINSLLPVRLSCHLSVLLDHLIVLLTQINFLQQNSCVVKVVPSLVKWRQTEDIRRFLSLSVLLWICATNYLNYHLIDFLNTVFLLALGCNKVSRQAAGMCFSLITWSRFQPTSRPWASCLVANGRSISRKLKQTSLSDLQESIKGPLDANINHLVPIWQWCWSEVARVVPAWYSLPVQSRTTTNDTSVPK